MAATEEQNPLLKDIKFAIISGLITYEFYSRLSVSVKIISGMHAFREMMLEEKIHVEKLETEFFR